MLFLHHWPRWTIIILMSLAYFSKVLIFGEMNPNRAWNKGDAYFYHFISNSLIEDGDLDLTNNHGPIPLDQGDFALSQHGYPTAKQSPLMSVIAMPLRLLFGPVGSLWFNILCSMGIVLLLYQLLNIWVSPVSSLLASLIVGLGSVLFRYAFNFSPDVFSCLILLSLIVVTFRQHWYLIGLFAGLAISAKIGNIIVVAPVLGYALWLLRSKHYSESLTILFKMSMVFLLVLAPFLIYNNWLFGSPFTTGYQAILIASQGVNTTISHTSDFNQPIFTGLITLFFNDRNGIAFDNWIILLPFLAGLFFIRKTHFDKLILLLIIIMIQSVFYASYDYQLASSLGNRFLLVSIALMAIPIGWFIEKIKSKSNFLTVGSGSDIQH